MRTLAALAAVGVLMAAGCEKIKARLAVRETAPATTPTSTNVPPTASKREVWQQAQGLCQYVDTGGGRWVEINQTGAVAFQFQETERTPVYIEFVDPNRGYVLRLVADAMYMRGGNPGVVQRPEFVRYYEGRWVK